MNYKQLILIALFFSFMHSLQCQTPKKIDRILLSFHEQGFNGNFLYSKNDTIIFTGNYGFKNYETKQLINDSTLFDLASCSKQITALAVIQLVENGSIDYSTTIEKIISKFPYKGVTVEHLLRHQSGLPDYMKFMAKRKIWNKTKTVCNNDVLNALIKFEPKINFSPGAKYEYSNTGYAILALLVEKISNRSFTKYLAKNIFEPAQMNSSRIYRRRYLPEKIPNLSDPYVHNKKTERYVPMDKDKKHGNIHWLDGVVGDGAIYSNLLDMEKWKQAIRYNKLISEESKSKMFSVDKVSTNYGYGVSVQKSKKYGKIISHAGAWAGYETLTFYIPKSNEFFVILCNNSGDKNSDIINQILKAI